MSSDQSEQPRIFSPNSEDAAEHFGDNLRANSDFNSTLLGNFLQILTSFPEITFNFQKPVTAEFHKARYVMTRLIWGEF